MGTSLSQAAPASHRITAEDRMERIGQLTTRQQTDALLWLAGYAPSVTSNSSTPATRQSSPGAHPACPCSHDQRAHQDQGQG